MNNMILDLDLNLNCNKNIIFLKIALNKDHYISKIVIFKKRYLLGNK